MISDAPYATEDLVLPAAVGLAGGVLASMVALVVLLTLETTSALSLGQFLQHAGLSVLPDSAGRTTATGTGLGLGGFAGALFGMLYASSQRRTSVRRLVGTGIFYGFLLWILGGFFARMFMDQAVSTVLHTWPWLLASVSYGVSLAILAVAWQSRHPAARAIESKD